MRAKRYTMLLTVRTAATGGLIVQGRITHFYSTGVQFRYVMGGLTQTLPSEGLVVDIQPDGPFTEAKES